MKQVATINRKYYAVVKGRQQGVIRRTWDECRKLVHKHPQAKFKSFRTKEEAEAYLAQNGFSEYNKEADNISMMESRSQPLHNQTKKENNKTHIVKGTSNKSEFDVLVYDSEEDSDSNKEYDVVQEDIDDIGWELVYTDGSCFNNGKHHAKGGVGVYFGEGDVRNVSEPYSDQFLNQPALFSSQTRVELFEMWSGSDLPRKAYPPTNNRAEIMAVICAIESVPLDSNIHIRSDSKYTINAVMKWMYQWKRNNWKLGSGSPVKNVDLFQYLYVLIQKRSGNMKCTHVLAHQGHHGNERADELARQGSENYQAR